MPIGIATTDARDTKAGKQARGLSNYLTGLSAEDLVADHYVKAGCRVLHRRWRGRAGEIDLILEGPEGLIFVEVKKGPDHARAAGHLTARQIGRVCASAEDYTGQFPQYAFAALRIDAALVDDLGRIDLLENISL